MPEINHAEGLALHHLEGFRFDNESKPVPPETPDPDDSALAPAKRAA
jgi:hypothetical protein